MLVRRCAGPCALLRWRGRDVFHLKSELDGRRGEPGEKVSLPFDRPPVIQEDLEGSPIGDPPQDEEAFGDQASDRRLRQIVSHSLIDDHRDDQHAEADGKRPPADAKQLPQIDRCLVRIGSVMLPPGA